MGTLSRQPPGYIHRWVSGSQSFLTRSTDHYYYAVMTLAIYTVDSCTSKVLFFLALLVVVSTQIANLIVSGPDWYQAAISFNSLVTSSPE